MADDLFILQGNKPAGAQDYEALRRLGVERITALCGEIWSNHNSSDPGIAMLEAMAYAITDLGYRTAFPVEDLLTRPDGLIGPASETGLFPAHEILTTSPVTVNDHRRLLIRIEGIRNVWLDPMTDPEEPDNFRLSETPVFADCLADALSHDPLNVEGHDNHPVNVSGLYRVLVELPVDDALGSLNEAALEVTLRAGPLKGVVLTLNLPGDTNLPFEQEGLPDPFDPDAVNVSNVTEVGNGIEFSANIEVEQGGNPIASLAGLEITVLEDRPRPAGDPVVVTAADLQDALEETGPAGPAGLFLRKREARRRALTAVRRVLHAHRPLCEDYLSIDSVAPYRVGLCADVDVTPAADLEEVEARILHAVELYLNPPPVFRTLDALLAEGVPADEIFNGPYVNFDFEVEDRPVFTKPGFISDDDLAACELRRKVHVSDLINIIIDLDGIVAVRDLTLRAYDLQGVPLGDTEHWTLEVPPGHQPVLFFSGTKLTLYKNELPYRAQPTELERTLEHLRALSKAELYVPPDQVLPPVRGRWRNLDQIPTLQNELPRNFGTDRFGLPPDATKERVAQSRQLKGYLTFFDQVLADYLGQLAAARRILSPDKSLERTWFPPHLGHFPGLREDFPSEFFVNPGQMTTSDMFRVRLNETEEAFLDRRARALNHLIARFAERFADYALISFQLSGDRLMTARELLDERCDFLAEYPLVSRERGEGFNQLPEAPAEIWNSGNISGLERRAGRLLGISDLDRRDLHCGQVFDVFFATREDGGSFRVAIVTDDDETLFSSEETFATAGAALNAARPLEFLMADEDTYVIDDSAGEGAVVLRLEGGGTVLTRQGTFTEPHEASDAARRLLFHYNALLQQDFCESEGMHLIEHILLRPRAPGDALMSVCLSEDCQFCGEEDPYSFRVSIVLPYWPERFRNLHFRRFAERVIREECPAHIHPRICWVDNADMAALDAAHRAWREALATWPRDDALLAGAAAELIEILDNLRTIYPPATLHDCDDGGDDNIVRLDETNLGFF
ncbi:hypothetical protein [Roseibium album]|uniref:Uncharacterized protein n=1 Tax=Roseibium album TaxID=311410 RepID=A0A0M6ZIZ0_9HYPH|nr:hypothetical protein [Roseibium album]CTQ62739.1 hypothetical protein LA5094_05531 [Roseibium album]CTQ78837.1 hypothetical protein LA5096_05868 [Roseibium album]CTQ80280.1 hypothetical protein LA5095_05514 [Roseibium album]